MSAWPRPADVVRDDLDAPFWAGCELGEFLLHRCRLCERAYWPASSCLTHGMAAMDWVAASGRGRVHTYTVFHHAYAPELAERVPYIIAVVILDEGPFFHTDLIDCAPDEVAVDLPVEVVFIESEPGVTLPHFRPVRPAASIQ